MWSRLGVFDRVGILLSGRVNGVGDTAVIAVTDIDPRRLYRRGSSLWGRDDVILSANDR